YAIYKKIDNRNNEEIKKLINKKVKAITYNYRIKIKTYKKIVKSIKANTKTKETYDFISTFIETYFKAIENFINHWKEKDEFELWIQNYIEKKQHNPENYNPLLLKKNINILEELHTEIEMNKDRLEKYIKKNIEFIIKINNILENLIERLKLLEDVENQKEKMEKVIESSLIYTYLIIEKYIKEKNLILATDDSEVKDIKYKKINYLKEVRKKLTN
ncbi:MAG: hypothetical protein ACK4J2_08530, partial [Sulfurihydrogenibium azorense]|uniref:hypothetical protein n=1 Tax=Sulfurihydrogenibium azorense TaxID=309806 RepID=UPI003919B865